MYDCKNGWTASKVCYMTTCPFNVTQHTGGCDMYITCPYFLDRPHYYTTSTGTGDYSYTQTCGSSGTVRKEEYEWLQNTRTITTASTQVEELKL